MIITALRNEEINNKLKEIYKTEVYPYDLSSYDDVISLINRYINQNENNAITLVVKEFFGEKNEFKDFIKTTINLHKEIKIVVILDKLEEDIKSFLFANEIFEIIEGNLVSIDKIVEVLNSDKKIIYKQIGNTNIPIKVENESIVIGKEMIAIYGTSGSGKSLFSTLIADKLSRDLNVNTALLDMDIQNPSIDVMANVEGDNNILSHLVEDVDKRDEISDIISKYLIRDRKNSNLSYMTNNVTLFECQNKLSNKYYKKIYSSVNQNYDYTIVDLPSSPFLDIVPFTLVQATKIFFVVNPNYVSIRQAIKYLELMNKLWSIPKEKVCIVINKIKKSSLDILQIKSLIPDYEVVCTINYTDDVESYINGAVSNQRIDLDIQKILKWMNIKNKNEKKMFNLYSILRKVGQKVDN